MSTVEWLFLEPHGRAAARRHVDGRKTGRRQSVGSAILLVAGLELDVAGAQHGRAAPRERLARALDQHAVGVDRLAIAVEPRLLAAQLRPQTLARLDPVP